MRRIFSTLLLSSALATAGTLPLAQRSALPYTKPSPLDEKCTFTLWHRQQSSLNYIQLNAILDHANNVTVDVASQRPATAFNSYTRLDQDHAFAVAGLLDDERLTIMYGGDDVLRFELGEMQWSSQDGHAKQREGGLVHAWCDAREWEGSFERRERKLGCAFPCAQVAEEDLEREYRGLPEGDKQAPISLQ